jgi:carboxylesterase
MKHIHPSDFFYMWRGVKQQALLPDQIHRLDPVDLRNNQHKRALLLLHGFASSPAVYRLILPALSGYDALICPVLPGHGSNLTDFSKATANDWKQAVESITEELVKTYELVDVMGLSLGGALACHLATKFPIHHLYLLAPALYLNMHTRTMRLCARLLNGLGIKQITNHAGNICSKAQAELSYQYYPIPTLIELLTFIIEFKPTLPTCPIDLFLGRHDTVVDVSRVAKLFDGHPNTSIHWLPQSAHVLPIDNDVQQIIHCVNHPLIY